MVAREPELAYSDLAPPNSNLVYPDMITSDAGAPGAHALARASGEFLAVDDGYADLLCMSPDALRRTALLEVTFPADREASLQALERMLRHGEPVHVRKRYVRGDGSSLWVAERLSRLRAAGETLLLAACSPLPSPSPDVRAPTTYV